MPTDLGIHDAFILAGGLGERLGELTESTQKVMLPIQGRPILEWNIEMLARFGVKRVVLGVGKHGEQIEEHFGGGGKFGEGGDIDVEMVYSRETEPLGTAGALKNAQALLGGGTFFMLNGDQVTDLDFGKMLAVHRSNKALATLALVPMEEVTTYGMVFMEGDRITRFVEKPKVGMEGGVIVESGRITIFDKDKPPLRLVSSGLYTLEPGVLDLIPAGRKASIERDVFPGIAEDGRLFGYKAECRWFPTDDKERYDEAQKQWKGFD